jgi:hypothetical protein
MDDEKPSLRYPPQLQMSSIEAIKLDRTASQKALI